MRSSAVNVAIHYIEITGYFSLQAPGKKEDISRTAWKLPAKLDISLWLGPAKHKNVCFKSLPTGYELTDGFRSHPSDQSVNPSLPTFIRYTEEHVRPSL